MLARCAVTSMKRLLNFGRLSVYAFVNSDQNGVGDAVNRNPTVAIAPPER
jgi:hypothetical protein